ATIPPLQAESSRINLQNTEIRTLVETVSKLTGKNFIIDPAVRGSITFVSGDGLSKDELYETFLSILQVHGLEALEVGNVIKIVPLNKGRSQVAPIITDRPAPAAKPGQPAAKPQPKIEADRTVTQVFTLQYIPVNTAIQTLQPLAGQGETRIQFNQASNAVIVTGRKQNVDRLGAVIKSIDKPNNQGFELVALRHSVANQLATTLRGLMSSGKSADGGAIPQRVYISVDVRTNSILVAGDKGDRERMRQVIAKLDIPRTQPPATQVVKIRYADATQLLETLKQLQIAPAKEGGAAVKQARMAVDKNTNSIIISGEREDREPILAAIQRLDIRPTRPPDTQVIRLKHADATKLLATMKQLQITPTAEGGAVDQVRLAIDESTNSIIVAGDNEKRQPIIAAIARLDTPRTQPADTQVVPVRYAVATQIIQTLKQLQVAPTEGNTAQQIRLAADERTNSILISGKQPDRLPIIAAIRKLDTPKSRAGGTRVVRLRYAQAEELVAVLKETASSVQKQTEGTAAAGATPAASGGVAGNSEVSIQADKTTNSVIITAPEHLQVSLQRVISQLDQRRPQVMVEAIIAEVSTDLSNKFGFGLVANGISSGDAGIAGYSNFGGLGTALGLAAGATSIPGGFLLGAGSDKFGIVLEALKGDGATNILSTPTLATLDNEEASIVVGQNVPFVTGSFSSTEGGSADNPFQTITRQDVGLTLKVTPQINRDKTITMKIEQEVSSLSTSSSASDVITNKSSINTNVMVEDGQVLVLGGLIQDNFNDSETKVPVLGDLPIIGNIFKGNTTTKKKQNLMVFIHPVIMADRQVADAYTRGKYHNLQKQQKQSKILTRGSLTGSAAVFPDIECIDGFCAKGSADDLHFNIQAAPQRDISGALRTPYQVARPLNVNESAFTANESFK
ncbi:MAG: General secretion pathway protein D, partial [uncultured Thiotrichaceae bacterium]